MQWKFAVLEAVAPPHYFDGRYSLADITVQLSIFFFFTTEGGTLTFSQFLLDPTKGK